MTADKKSQGNQERFWTPLRVALTVVVFSLIAVAGISSCNSSDERENRPVATQQGTLLPANVRSAKLRTADGGTISLADYSGKVVLVNLWATWCGPCRVETPELVRLHKEFQSQGVEMVGLSTENPDASAANVKNFVKAFQVDYHVGWAPSDVAIWLMELTGRNAIPQSFIISREGRVLKQFVGFNQVTTPPQIRQAIEDALKGT
ncbi:MAG TPA: TlpA disulfide reductase family protein [Pyrinomonadaceae bacterium]|nr:TlpA disulfide reductase family protein [Pyrinomonadaceae bacterium]